MKLFMSASFVVVWYGDAEFAFSVRDVTIAYITQR
jgi:hypothetical protein